MTIYFVCRMAYKAALIFCILLLSFPAKVGGMFSLILYCLKPTWRYASSDNLDVWCWYYIFESPRYKRNIVESGAKHQQAKKNNIFRIPHFRTPQKGQYLGHTIFENFRHLSYKDKGALHRLEWPSENLAGNANLVVILVLMKLWIMNYDTIIRLLR